MNTKLILLCAPSGTGKTTVARMLTSTDSRFRHIQVLTTRTIRPNEDGRIEKVKVDLKKLQAMQEKGELVNFNEKDGDHYGIRHEEIESALNEEINPVLEWDINRLDYWDNKFQVFKVILLPETKEKTIQNLLDGRDPNGMRKTGVLKELEYIESGQVEGDLTIINFDAALIDTVQKIRETLFGSQS